MLFSCIVPFCREDKQIVYTLQQLLKVPDLTHIICVNDSHDDKLSLSIIKKFPSITVLTTSKNSGKSNAINTALPYLNSKYVLLFDADLKNIVVQELSAAIKIIKKQSKIDMIIMYLKTQNKVLSRFSGQRILKTEDLKKIFKRFNPTGFQLELCINEFMKKEKKTVQMMDISSLNTKKSKKYGILKTLFLHVIILQNIIEFQVRTKYRR